MSQAQPVPIPLAHRGSWSDFSCGAAQDVNEALYLSARHHEPAPALLSQSMGAEAARAYAPRTSLPHRAKSLTIDVAHNKRLLRHSPLSPGGNVAHLPSGSRPDSPLSPGRTWAHIIDMQNRGATTPLSSSEGASSPRELASSLPDGIGLGFPSPRARAKDGLGTMSAERTETLRRMAAAPYP